MLALLIAKSLFFSEKVAIQATLLHSSLFQIITCVGLAETKRGLLKHRPICGLMWLLTIEVIRF